MQRPSLDRSTRTPFPHNTIVVIIINTVAVSDRAVVIGGRDSVGDSGAGAPGVHTALPPRT